MFSKIAYLMNYLLEYEERLKASQETRRDVDYSRRYVEGAIQYNDEIIHYETIRQRQFIKVYKEFKKVSGWEKGHSVLDYGCGKGYILYLLNRHGSFDRIAGIEILPELCTIAENNIKNSNIVADIVCADARKYEKIDLFDVFFMFNPFPKEAMNKVSDRIYESLERVPRKIYILYINSVCSDILLERIPQLHCVSNIKNLPRYGCYTEIYTNDFNENMRKYSANR